MNFSERDTRYAILELFIGLAVGVGLVIFFLVQLFYRSSTRHRNITVAQRRIRLFSKRLLEKPPTDPRHQMITAGSNLIIESRKIPIPQYGRTIPMLVRDKDIRKECLEMMEMFRDSFVQSSKADGTSYYLTMRAGLGHLRGLLEPEEVSEFLNTYEQIVYGNCCTENCEIKWDEIRAMQIYFRTVIMRVLKTLKR